MNTDTDTEQHDNPDHLQRYLDERAVQTTRMIDVESSLLQAIGYDPGTSTLLVRFRPRKDALVGALYRYRNFGETDWQALRDADSQGRYFQQHIKPHADRYPFERVHEGEPE